MKDLKSSRPTLAAVMSSPLLMQGSAIVAAKASWYFPSLTIAGLESNACAVLQQT
ncbi:hypothetical protein [Aerosakkonema funiforme]|uniref:hypothetical protein n=1 Tax=Aerosakkonema funiforme TaxID=1246630 RepID=UPI00168350DE|nr:hypothetical protein [Aerosakkonema funiforme]